MSFAGCPIWVVPPPLPKLTHPCIWPRPNSTPTAAMSIHQDHPTFAPRCTCCLLPCNFALVPLPPFRLTWPGPDSAPTAVMSSCQDQESRSCSPSSSSSSGPRRRTNSRSSSTTNSIGALRNDRALPGDTRPPPPTPAPPPPLVPQGGVTTMLPAPPEPGERSGGLVEPGRPASAAERLGCEARALA